MVSHVTRRKSPIVLSLVVIAMSLSGAAQGTLTVNPDKELVITDPSVVESPVETTFDPNWPSGVHRQGAWSFGRLVHNMLPAADRHSAAAASSLVMDWLHTWEEDQYPNPGVSAAAARPTIRLLITNPWKAESGCPDAESPATDSTCVLNLAKAPFRLIAIVNRPDLRIVTPGATAIGGEGRFVFQVMGPTLGVNGSTGFVEIMNPAIEPQKFTVIFEYSLPVARAVDTLLWARHWHNLGAVPFGTAFNSTLRGITNGFSGPDTDPRRVNGNAINQVRTNEVALMGARFPLAGFVAARQFWELREFQLTPFGLEPHTVTREPSRDFDIPRSGQIGGEGLRTHVLVDYLTANGDAVLASTHDVPRDMAANSALVGSAPFGAWGKLTNPNPPMIPSHGVAHNLAGVSIPVRDSFALNTCAGCHRHETDTRHFMHITALGAMEPATRVDDRARIGVAPDAPPNAVVLSNFLMAEIGPGGPRFQDFVSVLTSVGSTLQNAVGLRVCAK